LSRQQWQRWGQMGAQIGMPPAVFLLLMANLAVFLLQFLTVAFAQIDPIGRWFSFIPYLAVNKLQIWRFASYMFLHDDLNHLFVNMIGLWLFGSRMELHWGTRTFAWYYFICGLGGAVLHAAFSLTGMAAISQMVGASGAIFGILLAFGLAFPRAVIYLFFVVPMPAFLVVILFGLFSLMGIGGSNIAHMAHLGGMVTGFIFLWIFTGGRLSAVPRLPGPGGARGGYRTVDSGYRSGGTTGGLFAQLYHQFVRWRTRLRLKIVGGTPGGDGKSKSRGGNGSPGGGKDLQRVDEILEKISREGLKSLSPEEQDILRRASKKN